MLTHNLRGAYLATFTRAGDGCGVDFDHHGQVIDIAPRPAFALNGSPIDGESENDEWSGGGSKVAPAVIERLRLLPHVDLFIIKRTALMLDALTRGGFEGSRTEEDIIASAYNQLSIAARPVFLNFYILQKIRRVADYL